MSVVVLDEAHLVVEWQVFDICLALFPFTTVQDRDFSQQLCFGDKECDK